MKEITVEEFKILLEQKPQNTLFVDVRTNDERNEGYIEGTIHIPLSELSSKIDTLESADKIYFQCARGGRSATACNLLSDLGFTEAINVLGGIEDWKSKGYSIVK